MDKMRDLCAEHLDYLSYIQDIFKLEVPQLSHILCKYLITTLFLPLYLGPIANHHHTQPGGTALSAKGGSTRPKNGEAAYPMSLSVSLFLTAHVSLSLELFVCCLTKLFECHFCTFTGFPHHSV